MTGSFTVACIQFTAARDYEPNINVVSDLVRRARDAGADFVLTPENTGLIEPNGRLRREKACDEASHPALAALCEVARETGIWLLIGSLAVDISGEPGTPSSERRLANRSYLIDAAGGIVASYDKIHMFDVDLASGESYRESNAFRPGAPSGSGADPVGCPGHDASVTICGFRNCTAFSPGVAPTTSRSRRLLRSRLARRIGTCCCGRGRSKTAASSSRRRNGASTPGAGGPSAHRLSSIRGAKCSPMRAKASA